VRDKTPLLSPESLHQVSFLMSDRGEPVAANP